MIRFSLFLTLLAFAPVASATAQGEGSDLDRLSSTDGILGDASRAATQPETFDAAPPGPPPEAPPVPLDGGLMLLAIAGAGYAARRLRTKRA